jgi:hypothetical protein
MGSNDRKGISYTFNKNSPKYVPKYNKEIVNGNTPIEINRGVRQECPLSPILFVIYIDKVIEDWLKVFEENILAKT